MKKITLFFLVIFFSVNGYCQATFQKTYGGTGTEYGWCAQQTFDGGYIITGYTSSVGAGSNDAFLIKTDNYGDTTWTKTFGGSGDDLGYAVKQNPDGGYTIACNTMSFGSGSFDIYLIRTDANGDTLWTRTIGGSGSDAVESMDLTADGGYILGGHTSSFGGSGISLYLVKTDSSGTVSWTKTFGGNNSNYGFGVKQTNDGGFILVGSILQDIYLVKTNAIGDTLWTKTFLGTALHNDFANSVFQTSDNGYIIAGGTFSYGAGGEDAFLLKTDSAGNQVWFKTFGGVTTDYGYRAEQTTDGGYVLFGYVESFGAGDADIYLVKTDVNGNIMWEKTYGGTGSDVLYYGEQTADGGYVMTGTTINSFGPGYNLYLVKTDSLGNVVCNTASVTATVTQPSPPAWYSAILISSGGIMSGTTTIINGGCDVATICISTDAAEITSEASSLLPYPNPVFSELLIGDHESPILYIEICNALGEKIYQNHPVSDTRHQTISVADFPSGIYFVKMKTDRGMSAAKFVKQ